MSEPSDGRATKLPGRTSRKCVVDYVSQVAPSLVNEVCLAVVVPWPQSTRPPVNVIVADPCNEVVWDQEDIVRAATNYRCVVVAGTFEVNYERKVLRRLLGRFDAVSDTVVMALQLLEDPYETSKEYQTIVMARYQGLLSLGCGSVILNPESDPERLRRQVEQELAIMDINAARAQQFLPNVDQELEQTVRQHHRLLWHDLPKALMRSFPAQDNNLHEGNNRVDNYQLLHEYQTHSGDNTVLLAARQDDRARVVLKMLDKSSYIDATDLEGIYREYTFLKEQLDHPNIVKCFELLHCPSRVYFVLEFGGLTNLLRVVEQGPGGRMDATLGRDCLRQVADGLAFCHEQGVVHRDVSLRHIAVDDADDDPGRFICRMVDFNSGMKCPREDTTSSVMTGEMPYIAPEVVNGRPYLPRPIDCWSVGVALLEAVGGLESLSRSAGYTDDDDLETCCVMVSRYFSREGSHATALAIMNRIQCAQTVSVLQAALKPDPTARASMADLHAILS